MKQRLLSLLLFSFLIVISFSCEQDSESVPEDVSSHTSLIYIVADNNLYSFAANDIEEIIAGYAEVEDPKNNKLLVYIDDKDAPRLLNMKIENNEVVAEIIEEYPEQNSLNIGIMSKIMNRALSEFKADSYGLTLWSHGDGWLPGTEQEKNDIAVRSFGEDSNNNIYTKGARMDIKDLKVALESLPKFDYLLFDACDMQGVEVAYELRNITDYLISSPVEVPAFGANYINMVPAYFSESNKAEQIARAYYDEYAQNYDDGTNQNTTQKGNNIGVSNKGSRSGNNNYEYGIAISVIKSAALEELARATKNVIQNATDNTLIKTENILSYDSNYYNFYYDMESFVASLGGVNTTAFKNWKQAYVESVPLFLTTPSTFSSYSNGGFGGKVSMAGATGVSIFIPNNKDFWQAFQWSRSSGESVLDSYYYYQDYYKTYEWYNAVGWDTIIK